MLRRDSPKPGDAFEKVGTRNEVWRLERYLDASGLPPHVVLRRATARRDTIVVSLAALMDRHLYRPSAVASAAPDSPVVPKAASGA